MFSDFRNVWQSNGRGPRFRMWILNEDLRKAEISRESDLFFSITGIKPDEGLTQFAMIDLQSHTFDEQVQTAITSVELIKLIEQNVYCTSN